MRFPCGAVMAERGQAPSLRGANGSRECAPDDRLRDEAIHITAIRDTNGLLRFARNDEGKSPCTKKQRGHIAALSISKKSERENSIDLEQSGAALAAADAHGDDAPFGLAAVAFLQDVAR